MSGRITIDNLSDSLKELISNGGLTEEQVLILINENGLSEEQVLNLINENGLTEEQVLNLVKTNLTGDISQLSTQEKGSLVGAINELFQSANNGKELIASAIGEPVSADDTFSAMSNDINGLLDTFKTNMMNNGITVESSDKFKALIDKLEILANDRIELKTGSVDVINDPWTFRNYYNPEDTSYSNMISGPYGKIDIESETLLICAIFVSVGKMYNKSDNSFYSMNLSKCVVIYDGEKCIASILYGYQSSTEYSIDEWYNYCKDILANNSGYGSILDLVPDIENNQLIVPAVLIGLSEDDNYTYEYAIKRSDYFTFVKGASSEESDDVLRDTLASILEDESVYVSDLDDMASLINKVDAEFTKDNNTINDLNNQIADLNDQLSGAGGTYEGTAVASDVLSGKTFMNSTGQVVTGTMVNRGSKTITPSSSTQTLSSGYYSGITIKAVSSSSSGSAFYTTTATTVTLTSTGTSADVSCSFGKTPSRIVLVITNAKAGSYSSNSVHYVDSYYHYDDYDCYRWVFPQKVGGADAAYIYIDNISSTGFTLNVDDLTPGSGTITIGTIFAY